MPSPAITTRMETAKLDANFFGIPTEGTGSSNNACWLLGPPKFRGSSIPLDRDTAIAIRIRY